MAALVCCDAQHACSSIMPRAQTASNEKATTNTVQRAQCVVTAGVVAGSVVAAGVRQCAVAAGVVAGSVESIYAAACLCIAEDCFALLCIFVFCRP